MWNKKQREIDRLGMRIDLLNEDIRHTTHALYLTQQALRKARKDLYGESRPLYDQPPVLGPQWTLGPPTGWLRKSRGE